ncbi:hypothetical protein [Streptantibioticus ferralitis]|uniref:Uncharacterized protein n=1 Tax=Streptantibioticus ferralitis TaxID=236510 RepID=A0ABT5ZC38_9ACTN|nr:hypothetical protein [Streptantibioticus ferralitis]MDF2261394.1 hypothetical protein [Streptantibioticus ferralitis]
MSQLLDLVLEAHGGLRRWKEARSIHAKGTIGGLLWSLHGQEGILTPADMTVDVQQERLVYEGFTSPGLRGIFTPDRVAVERPDGEVVLERTAPREAFAGLGLDSPWDQLHVLYFAGYALWNYLTAPYLLTRPGVVVEELEPWREADEDWRRLRATFPKSIATHATEQVFYYNAAGLLRRHDYDAEVLGSGPAAHYAEQHRTFSGLVFPTHRYVVPIGEDGRSVPELVLITIDFAEISVTS